jgi:hypothetical protein
MLSRLFATSLALAALVTFGSPQPALARGAKPTPTPSVAPSVPPENPAVTLIARREFVSWQAGMVDAARYAPQSQSGLTPDRVTKISKELGAAGTLEKTEWVGPVLVDGVPGAKGYIYKMTCSDAVVYERLILAADGKIDGVVFLDKLPK